MASWLVLTIKIFLFLGTLFGLFGLIVPAFPGLTVMWVLILAYGLIFGFDVTGAVLFAFISLLAIAGMLSDNVLMIGKARQGGAKWHSIAIASVVGLFGSILLTPIGGVALTLLALYLSEYAHRRDKRESWEVTKDMAIGWGWAFVVRFSLGVVIMILWGVWEIF